MSAGTSTYQYSAATVYGSVAYDLSREEFWRGYSYGDYEYFGDAAEETPIPQEREEVYESVSHAASAQGVSPFAILGFAFAAMLIVFSLFARIQLSELSDQCAHLETSITELGDAQARLRITYESAFNLTEIEDYAIETLGMQKPLREQIVYIDTNSQDRVEVLSGGESVGVADRIGDAVSEFLTYFTRLAE